MEEISFSSLSLNDNTNSQLNIQLAKLKDDIFSSEVNIVFDAVVALRKLVSLEQTPPLKEVVSLGFIPRLLDLLASQVTDIQCEACWVITNILSGSTQYVDTIIKLGGLERLHALITTKDVNLREQCIWALGNIAGDNNLHRDLVIQTNVLPILLQYIESDTTKLSSKRLLVWTVSNFCRGKPKPAFHAVRCAIPVMAKIIKSEVDNEILVDALWSLSYLSDATNDEIYEIIKAGVAPDVIRFLHSEQVALLVPALRTFGNLVTGDDKSTLYMLSMNSLPALKKLLSSPKSAIIKEAVWSLSNIFACTRSIIQMAIEAQVLPQMVQMLTTVREDIQKEILWCFSNLVDGADQNQINYLMADLNCFTIMCTALASFNKHKQELDLIVSALANTFKHCKTKREQYMARFLQFDGLTHLHRIQNSFGLPTDTLNAITEIISYFGNQ